MSFLILLTDVSVSKQDCHKVLKKDLSNQLALYWQRGKTCVRVQMHGAKSSN